MLEKLAMTSNMKLLPLFYSVIVSILLLCCVDVSSQERETSCYCVRPDGSETDRIKSCQGECHPLMYYANSSTEVFRNDSTFYFLPGNHFLREVVRANKHMQNLALIGCSDNSSCNSSVDCNKPVATVLCAQQSNGTGFLFRNIHNLSIIGLRFNKCGFIFDDVIAGALILNWVWNLTMCGVEINYSNGRGLSCYQVSGTSIVAHTSISHSHSFSKYKGGNMQLVYHQYLSSHSDTTFTVTNSNISNGINTITKKTAYGGGIDILIKTTDRVHILLYDVTLMGNHGHNGGNLAVTYWTVHNSWPSRIIVDNCRFLQGSAHLGGGLYLSFIVNITHQSKNIGFSEDDLTVSVTDSEFTSNTADAVGAGVYLQLHEHNLLSAVANVSFIGCTFDGNTNLNHTYSRGGSAVNLINFHIPGYVTHQSPQYNISFLSCNFTENSGQLTSEDSVGSGTLYVEENAYMVLRNCTFADNSCPGITAVHSNIILQGNIVLRNNTGYNGGGMVLCANSVIYLNLLTYIYVLIENCHANNYGGGIYAEFECTQAIPPCFFQVSDSNKITRQLVHINNNTASTAGTALFGGAIDYCYSYGLYSKRKIFNDLFDIHPAPQNNLSNISSNPFRVCFCDESGFPNCNEHKKHYGSVYPGDILSVSVVVVGQREGTVPGIVIATLKSNPHVFLKDLQNTPKTRQNCTTLKYTIESDASDETINLSVGSTDFKNARIDTSADASIVVSIKRCPLGFKLIKQQCKCSNHVKNLEDVSCAISDQSILRNGNSTWWLGFINSTNNSHTISNEYCPFDYCVTKSVKINTTTKGSQDIQCANNRTGVLCGACKDRRSNVFGSTICKHCHNSILRTVGLTVLFALLGIVLVLFLGILDLSVTEGTLSAIVFYMNVVRVNTSMFFDFPKDRNSILTSWLKVFVAWMNLDLGIETCFYNGMGAVENTALQFVFPLYLSCLAGLIIYFSRKSSLVTKLVGKNAVKILATLVLHFYAKLLRTIIDIVRVSIILSDNYKSIQVWTIDGSIPYFHKTHGILLACAVIVAVITLPYTLALLFIQCLRKRSNMKVLFWVNKLKPFFDAYTGPYKDKYHFWTGFLLIIRIVLFVVIALNTSKGPILNFTLIIATTSLLFLLIQPGIYKKWTLNIMEAFTYFNLIVFVALTTYDFYFKYANKLPIIICIGSMFLLFCGVVVYHAYKKLSDTQRWRKVNVWLLQRRWPWMKQKPIRSLILHINPDIGDELSSSDSELDPILHNAPPVARYDEYREPLIETGENT